MSNREKKKDVETLPGKVEEITRKRDKRKKKEIRKVFLKI